MGLNLTHTVNMKVLALIALIAAFPLTAIAKQCSRPQIKIAIIDTGLNLNDVRFEGKLCKRGHKNFVPDETLDDIEGHGTFVAGLITQYAKRANYCLLIYKFHKESSPGPVNLDRELSALKEAVDNKADIINFSAGGSNFNESEALMIKYHPEITFVVAAGNEHHDMDIPGNEYYPASLFYPNMEVVGSVDKNGNRSAFSNYSKRIEDKEVGENVTSYLPNNEVGTMSGTSMATAIFSGKLIDAVSKTCKDIR